MIYMDLTLEDNRIIGRMNNVGIWVVYVWDLPTGKSFSAEWSQDQFNAAVILAMAGEDNLLTEDVRAKLYEIVGPLFVNHPKECRFVP